MEDQVVHVKDKNRCVHAIEAFERRPALHRAAAFYEDGAT